MKNKSLFSLIIPLAFSSFILSSCTKKEEITDDKEKIKIINYASTNTNDMTRFERYSLQRIDNGNGIEETHISNLFELYDDNYVVIETSTSYFSNELSYDTVTKKHCLVSEKYVASCFLVNDVFLYSKNVNTNKATAKTFFEGWKNNFNLYFVNQGRYLTNEIKGYRIGNEYEFTVYIKSSYISELTQTIKIKNDSIYEVKTIKKETNKDGEYVNYFEEKISLQYNTTKSRDSFAWRLENELLSSVSVAYKCGKIIDSEISYYDRFSTVFAVFNLDDSININCLLIIDYSADTLIASQDINIRPIYYPSFDSDFVYGESTTITLDPKDCILEDTVYFEDGLFKTNDIRLYLNITINANFSRPILTINKVEAKIYSHYNFL